MPEVYVSTDVESDGPIPGPHSMLSFASAAYRADKTLVSTFTANLETLPGAAGHPNTMAWWAQQPEAWKAARADPEDPAAAMARYVAWVKALPGRPVFVISVALDLVQKINSHLVMRNYPGLTED